MTVLAIVDNKLYTINTFILLEIVVQELMLWILLEIAVQLIPDNSITEGKVITSKVLFWYEVEGTLKVTFKVVTAEFIELLGIRLSAEKLAAVVIRTDSPEIMYSISWLLLL